MKARTLILLRNFHAEIGCESASAQPSSHELQEKAQQRNKRQENRHVNRQQKCGAKAQSGDAKRRAFAQRVLSLPAMHRIALDDIGRVLINAQIAAPLVSLRRRLVQKTAMALAVL
jgi:hypothetical protein